MPQRDLPPGQQLVAPGKWPVVGQRAPLPHSGDWQVTVCGQVSEPQSWKLSELRELPQVALQVDIHCVTRWSKPGARFGGVLLQTLLQRCQPSQQARFISFVAHSENDHQTSLPLDDALRLQTLLALTYEQTPLPEIHGGPVRVIVPQRYFYKSLKWLSRIEVLNEDRLGNWEAGAGYHNEADPWQQQRYMAVGISKQEAAKLLASRNFTGRDLRSLDASGRDLTGLDATGALLRDADFEQSVLVEARFVEANLSNARFRHADLRRSNLTRADLEGADFSGADLRGADLRGASLLAATFSDELGQQRAQFDAATQLDESAIEQLLPTQAKVVQEALKLS